MRDVVKFFSTDERVLEENIPAEEEKEGLKEPLIKEIKKEKDLQDNPDVKVEISAEFSKYLKEGEIKTEKVDVENNEVQSEKDKKIPEKSKTEKLLKSKKGKGKGKKSKKDIKSKALRKHKQDSPTSKEGTDEVKVEEGNSVDKKATKQDSGSDSCEAIEDAIKLHEDIVNSVPDSVKVKDRSEDLVEVKNKEPKENEIIIDDDHDEHVKKKKEIEDSHEKGNKEVSNSPVDEKSGEKEVIDEKPLSPTPTMEYTCKGCKTDFETRPKVIIHIITEHLKESFADVPIEVEDKFRCHHPGKIQISLFFNELGAFISLLGMGSGDNY